MKMILKYGSLIIAAIFLSACDDTDILSRKGQFYYSNPSEKSVFFKLDGELYNILPNSHGVILLPSGAHQLENDIGQMTNFFVFDNNSGGIINPKNFVYYTLSEVYLVDDKGNNVKLASYPIATNGHKFVRPIRRSNATLIDGNIFRCSYPVGKSFPHTSTFYGDKRDGHIKSKCFDKAELIKYLTYAYGKKLLQNTMNEDALGSVNIEFLYEIPSVDFENINVQLKAGKLIRLAEEIKKSDDANIHKKLNKDFYNATTEFIYEYELNSTSNTISENEKYNRFIKEINMLRENGIWLKS